MMKPLETKTEPLVLLGLVKERVRQNIHSQRERSVIELLLDNLIVYSKRVMGVQLTEADLRLPEHQRCSGISAVPSQIVLDQLTRRLRVVLRFNITSPDKLERDLLYGIFPWKVDSLTTREVSLLYFLYQHPEASPPLIARELKTSPPTIRTQMHALVEKAGLRFAHFVDWRRFKFRFFIVCFETWSSKGSQQLKQILGKAMSTYRRAFTLDITHRLGWISFQIPDQAKPLQLFQRQLAQLEEAFFEKVQIHDVSKYYFSIGFDSFDFGTGNWHIEGDVSTLGLLTFAKENWEVLPRPQGITYTQSRPFDQLDYYIATFLAGDGRARMDKLKNRLKGVGLTIPRTTISTRKSQLLQEKAIVPFTLFGSPLLSSFITFAFRCDPEITEQLLISIAQMPIAFAYASNIGCFLSVHLPSQSLGTIIHLFSSLIEEEGVEEVLQIQQPRNLGSRTPPLGPKWNGSYWTWQEKEFLLPSLGLK